MGGADEECLIKLEGVFVAAKHISAAEDAAVGVIQFYRSSSTFIAVLGVIKITVRLTLNVRVGCTDYVFICHSCMHGT